MLVVAGSSMTGEGDAYSVRRAYRHPRYDREKVDYDVSVIVIDGRFDSNRNQIPIPLSKHTDIESLVGLECLVTGYGRTSVSQPHTF